MQNKIFKIFHPIVTVLLLFIMVSSVISEERSYNKKNILRKMSDVIPKARENCLSPEVTDEFILSVLLYLHYLMEP